jgi:GH15 family glucan-1,4-alpha-glucosidase
LRSRSPGESRGLYRQSDMKPNGGSSRLSIGGSNLKSYTTSYGSGQTDISLMLMPIVGFIGPRNPRMLSTFERIKEELEIKRFFYRYRFDDGQPPGEGAFLTGSFWVIHYLARIGNYDEAVRRLEHVLSYSNHAGLFGEEIDPESGATLGNFPQAFTHVGLINSVMAIAGNNITETCSCKDKENK